MTEMSEIKRGRIWLKKIELVWCKRCSGRGLGDRRRVSGGRVAPCTRETKCQEEVRGYIPFCIL